jgi:hypothetical protein
MQADGLAQVGTRYHVEVEGDLLHLRRRRSSLWMVVIPAAIFIAWEIVWSFGCVMLIRQALEQQTLEHFLFAIPFLTAWVFVAVVLAYMLTGFETIEVGPGGLEYRRGLLGWALWRRRIPRNEIKEARLYEHMVENGEGGSTLCREVKIESLGRAFCFGRPIESYEGIWLAEQINQHLQTLGPVATAPNDALPSDSTLQQVELWNGVELRRRVRLDLATIGVTTAMCFFWNGIVGIFLLQLSRQFQWFPFLFLIPFELVGLTLLAAWVGVITAPLTIRRWILGPEQIAARTAILGLGWTRRLDAADLAHVEFREVANPGKSRGKVTDQTPASENESPFAVALLDHEENDRLVIPNLTEGEARWLHRTFCETYQAVLARSAPRIPASTEGLWDRELDR